MGTDAFGIDLSATAVINFQNKYPQYADRVQCGTRFNKTVDVVYCNALFEHLDDPGQFLQDASDCLGINGLIILDGLPMVNIGSSDINVEEDISFWKPCHRAIYSQQGLNILLSNHGFTIKTQAVIDDYYYRVLSLHIIYGYKEIIKLRDSCIKHKGLPGLLKYWLICRKALYINSLAHHGCIVFKKQ